MLNSSSTADKSRKISPSRPIVPGRVVRQTVVGNAERAGLSLGEMRKADNRDLLQAYLLTSLRPSMSGQNGQVFVDQNRNIEAKGLDAARNLRNLLPTMLPWVAPIEFKNT
jgi:hypothetical protein